MDWSAPEQVLIVYSFKIWEQDMSVLFSVSADTNGQSQKTRPRCSPSSPNFEWASCKLE